MYTLPKKIEFTIIFLTHNKNQDFFCIAQKKKNIIACNGQTIELTFISLDLELRAGINSHLKNTKTTLCKKLKMRIIKVKKE